MSSAHVNSLETLHLLLIRNWEQLMHNFFLNSISKEWSFKLLLNIVSKLDTSAFFSTLPEKRNESQLVKTIGPPCTKTHWAPSMMLLRWTYIYKDPK
ncbi:unnamed protein product [Urochloa humidicola]